MKYSFTFDSVSAYQSAKATSSSNLYIALNTSSPLSRTCISTITATGQTFVDSVNIIVPREDGGEIGDTLLYKEGSYYWLKGHMFLSQTRSQNGSNCFSSSELASAGYTIIGFVGHREDNRCLIFCDINSNGNGLTPSRSTIGTKKWDDYSTSESSYSTPGPSTDKMPAYGNINRREGRHGKMSTTTTFFAMANRRYAEEKDTSVNYREMPILRSSWDAVVAHALSNTNIEQAELAEILAGINGNPSATPPTAAVDIEVNSTGTIGRGKITYSLSGNTKEVYVDEYDYDYSLWYECNLMPAFPTDSNCMTDMDGRVNTKYLQKYNGTTGNSANTTVNYPAANVCWEYGFENISEFAAGKWWMPSIVELYYLGKNVYALSNKGIKRHSSTSYSSSTQRATYYIWGLTANGMLSGATGKGGSYYVLPVSEFYI